MSKKLRANISPTDPDSSGEDGPKEARSSYQKNDEVVSLLMQLQERFGKDISFDELCQKVFSEKNVACDRVVEEGRGDASIKSPSVSHACGLNSSEPTSHMPVNDSESEDKNLGLKSRLGEAKIKDLASPCGSKQNANLSKSSNKSSSKLPAINLKVLPKSPQPKKKPTSISHVSDNPIVPLAVDGGKLPKTPKKDTAENIGSNKPPNRPVSSPDVQKSKANSKNAVDNRLSQVSPNKKSKKQCHSKSTVESDCQVDNSQPNSPTCSIKVESIKGTEFKKKMTAGSKCSSAATVHASKPLHLKAAKRLRSLSKNEDEKDSLKSESSIKTDVVELRVPDQSKLSSVKRKSLDLERHSPDNKKMVISNERPIKPCLPDATFDVADKTGGPVVVKLCPIKDSHENVGPNDNKCHFKIKPCSVTLKKIPTIELKPMPACCKLKKLNSMVKRRTATKSIERTATKSIECTVSLDDKAKDNLSMPPPSMTVPKIKTSRSLQKTNTASASLLILKKKRNYVRKPSKSVKAKKPSPPSTTQKPTEPIISTSATTSPPASTDLFVNYHQMHYVHPLDKLQMETEELDFEPGNNDDDDLMSIYADSTMFQNDTLWTKVSEDVLVHKSSVDLDTCSVGSNDSRSLSDMDIDSDVNDESSGNFNINPVSVENYPIISDACAEIINPGIPVENDSGDVVTTTSMPSVESEKLLEDNFSDGLQLSGCDTGVVVEDANNLDNGNFSGFESICEAGKSSSSNQKENEPPEDVGNSDKVDSRAEDSILKIGTHLHLPSGKLFSSRDLPQKCNENAEIQTSPDEHQTPSEDIPTQHTNLNVESEQPTESSRTEKEKLMEVSAGGRLINRCTGTSLCGETTKSVSCEAEINISNPSSLPLEATHVFNQNCIKPVSEEVLQLEMEHVREKAKHQGKHSPHHGVFFPPMRQIYPETERVALLPTPTALLPTPSYGPSLPEVRRLIRKPPSFNLHRGNLQDYGNNHSDPTPSSYTSGECMVPTNADFRHALPMANTAIEAVPLANMRNPLSEREKQWQNGVTPTSAGTIPFQMPARERLSEENCPSMAVRETASGYGSRSMKDFDYLGKSSKDVDYRIKDIDLGISPAKSFSVPSTIFGLHASTDYSSAFLTLYCYKYLSENCDGKHCPGLLHEFPPLSCADILDKDAFLKLIEEMLDHLHYWVEKDLDRVITDLGNWKETGLLLSIAELLWCRCSSDKAKWKKMSLLWISVAKGLCSCGLPPSKSVKQILHKIIHPRLGSCRPYDAIDALIDILYPEFIKGQSNVWECLSILARLKNYEIPAHIFREVLCDAIRYPKRSGDQLAIYRYLLTSSRNLQPRKPEEQDLLHLIHKFISVLLNINKEYAERLAEYFHTSVYNECCPPIPPIRRRSAPVEFPGKRFSLQRDASSQSSRMMPHQREYSPPLMACNTRSKDGGNPVPSVPCNVLPNVQNARCNMSWNPFASSSVPDNTRDEEVTSSTESFNPESLPKPTKKPNCTATVQTNAEAGKLKSPISLTQIKEYSHLKIVVTGTERGVTAIGNLKPEVSMTGTNGAAVTGVSKISEPVEFSRSTSVVTSSPPTVSQDANVIPYKAKKSVLRLREKEICSVLANKKYGTAAGMLLKWRIPETIQAGETTVFDFLKELHPQERVIIFTGLLTGVQGHMGGSDSDYLPKVTIGTIGLRILEDFLNSGHYKEAAEIHESLWSKMPPTDVELQNFSHSCMKLMSAHVYVESGKLKDALDIINTNKFFSHKENWSLPWNETDVGYRDKVCCTVFERLKGVDSFVLQAEKLFREMLNAKTSYQFDVGAKLFDDILRALLVKAHSNSALTLLVWAHNEHDLVPQRQATNRLVITHITSLPRESQLQYTPQVLLILGQEPYNKAVPNSIQGLTRVVVHLQSDWHSCEIDCIITFLLNCHICNLHSGQDIPDIAVEIQECQSQESIPGTPNIDSGIPAMQERVTQSLGDLIKPGTRFSNNSIMLDRQFVNNYVVERQNYVQNDVHFDKQEHVQHHPGIYPAQVCGSQETSMPYLAPASSMLRHGTFPERHMSNFESLQRPDMHSQFPHQHAMWSDEPPLVNQEPYGINPPQYPMQYSYHRNTEPDNTTYQNRRNSSGRPSYWSPEFAPARPRNFNSYSQGRKPFRKNYRQSM